MTFRKLIFYLVLTIGAVTFIYPFLWMASMSLRPLSEMGALSIFSTSFSFDNYLKVFQKIPIGRALLNSVIVSGCITALVVFFSSLTGYALARLRFKGRGVVFNVLLLTMVIPGQLTLIPLYTLIVAFGWVDSYLALILPFAINATAILIFRQNFLTIPEELLEAARAEGAGEFTILWRIVMPLSKPAIITVGIITFMSTWNEVLWPMIVIRDWNMMTMPQMVTLFAKGGQAGGHLGVELAAAMLLVLPIALAYLFLQRYFIEGMARTGLKG